MSNPHLLRHLESSIEAQKQDLQTLLLDNQRLAASHVALKQDLATSHANIQIFADATSKTRAERDAEIRNLIEELRRREEDAREVGVLKKELERARTEVEKLEKEKLEIEERAGKLMEGRKVNAEAGKVEEVRWEIEYIRHEVDRGKAAIEYEKKIHEDNLFHRQRMEEIMTSMAREAEQLRSELANTKQRARAAADVAGASNRVSSHPQIYGGSEVTYGGSSYTTTYGLHQIEGEGRSDEREEIYNGEKRSCWSQDADLSLVLAPTAQLVINDNVPKKDTTNGALICYGDIDVCIYG